jgi:hypothetical protein
MSVIDEAKKRVPLKYSSHVIECIPDYSHVKELRRLLKYDEEVVLQGLYSVLVIFDCEIKKYDDDYDHRRRHFDMWLDIPIVEDK